MTTNISGLMTSNSNEWSTPKDLFDYLDSMFHFTLDPCSTHENALCENHYTIAEDGLSQTWSGSVFVNPPYGKELPKWVKKCVDETQNCDVIVMLIPARTDTSYWRDYIFPNATAIGYVHGRLHFSDSGSATFPSAIVVFKSDPKCSWR